MSPRLQYPILFIDEYQDTEKAFAEALISHFVATGTGPQIGFFGDHWQKIYGTGCGKIEHPNLDVINKNANFRSVPAIVDYLNRMRPELPQQVSDPNSQGHVAIFHTNGWRGVRRTGQHWGGDLPPEVAHQYLDGVRQHLLNEGWDFSPENTKILMLTHKVLAAEQGYSNLENVFPYIDALIRKEDAHIAFFCETVEPVCAAYEQKRFGEMFAVLGGRTPSIRVSADKTGWARDMDQLLALRKTGTIGDVLKLLKRTERPRISDAVERKERAIEQLGEGSDDDERAVIERLRALRVVSYKEVIALDRFIDETSPFATKHGVKGAEFENVLVVIGRGWNQYNFVQFLEWARTSNGVPSNKRETFERNRNLLYVTVSRPKKRLAVLFTQEVTNNALATLSSWFGAAAIHQAPVP